jgi:hypothetical protein
MTDPPESRISRPHRRLADGEIAIMDGGMGTGLQAMGICDLMEDSRRDRVHRWVARLLGMV